MAPARAAGMALARRSGIAQRRPDPGGLPNPGHPIPCAQAGIAPEADGGYGQVHERAEARPRIRLGRPAQGAAGKRRRHRSGSAQACAGLRGSA
uniref:Uncharacterized protein n=1 Tax=Ralstonia solanacearum TaxID=305 RepID=A0A0S4WXU2_RALSL|nr:conserved protein of unknown function [Ralstonia solanacearum]